MPRERTTAVWLHGERVGEIWAPARAEVRFRYDDALLAAHPLNTPVLSCSLRTSSRLPSARPFFAGLLPEGDARRKMAADAGLVADDVLGLLRRHGQDVAGAVVVGDEVATRPRARAEPYRERDLAAEVMALGDGSAPLGLHEDSELSLPGLEDKLLLVRTRDGWARPVHGYPSTHILKLDNRAHPGLVMAEHACLQLARAAGLRAAGAELARLGGLDVLIVERFDREHGDGEVPRRVHQEDACQALGIDLERRPRAKYEEHGGPTLRQIAGLLEAWGGGDDLDRLLEQVVFTVVIGNADAHGKNISVLHPHPGRIELSPLYDTVPTALWPSLRTRAAMSVGAAVDLPAISVEDLVGEAVAWHLPERRARAVIRETLDRVLGSIDGTVIADHPKAHEALDHARARATTLASGTGTHSA